MFLKSPFIKREKTAKKKLKLLALALAMCLNQTACGAGKATIELIKQESERKKQ